MTNSDDFLAIRELCEDYYQQRITKEEYRVARSVLLTRIDENLNLNVNQDSKNLESRFLDRILSMFKNNDEEKMT